MALDPDDLSTSSALVVDGNPTSRGILVAQLRDFGMGTVVQTSRLTDARRQLEYRKFDLVLSELHFQGDTMSGQDLLDDLRRNQLLPFATVFIMVTGEATYAKVAEAAESALDGYLLKPHRASQLADRLHQARVRKASLQDIFMAIEAQDFAAAAQLCVQRFESRGLFWLYAARVGAELLLRTGQFEQAQKLYQAVVQAKTLPWAKLGVARAQLDSGETVKAVNTLENLVHEDPDYADAYDVLGRAQFEQGNLDAALQTYQLASQMTPASISRLQNLALMTFFMGERKAAGPILDRTVRLGLDSKMFDCQTLVLLAFIRLESGDSKSLLRCADDFARLIERNPDAARPQRLAEIVQTLALISRGHFSQALNSVRNHCQRIRDIDFDFESACNLMTLLALLAHKAIQLEEVAAVVDTLGLRFGGIRLQSELLASAAAVHPPYAEQIRSASARVLKLAEKAMAQTLAGDPGAAVQELLAQGEQALCGKLIETAYLVLNRYRAQITQVNALETQVQMLRDRFNSRVVRPALGEQKRQAGGLSLRSDASPAPAR
ncbi:MAG: response regulator [Rhodoferax sp.]|nr:response regulator [Rhodoferax sp.]